MAWVHICASSMAASAGLSQPFVDNTSTHACIKRTAVIKISLVSFWSSADNGRRDKWACTSTLAFTCGSLYFDLGSSLDGNRRDNF